MNSLKENFLLAADVIKKAKNILLIPHAKMDCDGMSSAIALHDILTQMGKNPTAVCPDPVPDTFKFLPSTDIFTTEISESAPSNTLLLTLNTADTKFSDLQYEVQDGKVNIIISSENAPFEEADFSFVKQSLQPDLIICLDSGDTKQLGKIYTDNSELFGSIPILNIDHHISNTQFGTVNLVEMKNSSTTEIIYDLIPYLDDRGHDLISADTATLLLAGLITDTGSFQHSNTTPKSLDTAAELIELGARQQEIIKHLFKTKSLATLRLWGRVLTQLKNDPMYRIVWSSVSKEDLQDTLSHSEDADGLIDELLSTTPGTEMVFLVKEREDGLISTSIRTSSSLVDATVFSDKFGGGGHRQAAGFKIRERGGKSFDEIVADIIFEAKKFQAERLGLSLPVGSITELTALAQVQPNTPEMTPEEMITEAKEESDEDLFPSLPDTVIPEINTQDFSEENIPETNTTPEPMFETHLDILQDRALEEKPVEHFVEAIAPEVVIQPEQNTKIFSEDVLPGQETRVETPLENVIPENTAEAKIEVKAPIIEHFVEAIAPEVTIQPEQNTQIFSEEVLPETNILPEQQPAEVIPDEAETMVESFADMLDMQEPEFSPEPIIPEPITVPEPVISELQKTETHELPDFLQPENIENTLENHVENIAETSFTPEKTSAEDSNAGDEFALFLANAQEKEEDEKFDTSFAIPEVSQDQNYEIEPEEGNSLDHIFEDQFPQDSAQQVSFHPTPEISAPDPIEQEDDFLNFLNQESDQKPVPVETKKTEPEFLAPVTEEEFGDDFLAALREENPELSHIETPTPEIFEIEKPSELETPEIFSAVSPFETKMAEQPIQHVQPENSAPQQNFPPQTQNPFA